MWFSIGFGAFCGTNSGRTRRSHKFFSYYPIWLQKESILTVSAILNSLRQVLEAFEHRKHIVFCNF